MEGAIRRVVVRDPELTLLARPDFDSVPQGISKAGIIVSSVSTRRRR